jgi:hypothetical protein
LREDSLYGFTHQIVEELPGSCGWVLGLEAPWLPR